MSFKKTPNKSFTKKKKFGFKATIILWAFNPKAMDNKT